MGGFCTTNAPWALPAARQVVYFEVAEPRAVILIKAAGPLPEETEQYLRSRPTVRAVLSGLDMAMLQVCSVFRGHKPLSLQQLPKWQSGPEECYVWRSNWNPKGALLNFWRGVTYFL